MAGPPGSSEWITEMERKSLDKVVVHGTDGSALQNTSSTVGAALNRSAGSSCHVVL
jgi:hypothetical protein